MEEICEVLWKRRGVLLPVSFGGKENYQSGEFQLEFKQDSSRLLRCKCKKLHLSSMQCPG
jgi:hypothetical protein